MPGERTIRRLKALENLLGVLRQYAVTAGGTIYTPGTTVKLPSGDEVYPDAVFLRRPLPMKDALIGAPDLIVQILHNSSPDGERILKRALYEKNAVREYWIMDAVGMTFEVMTLVDKSYRAVGTFGAGTSFASPLLSGLTVDVGTIFL